jgi:rare lipoprotein A (peptidoglycan hydrolase)
MPSRSVDVEVTDRGPYYGCRDLDLSAAEKIGLTYADVDRVEVD